MSKTEKNLDLTSLSNLSSKTQGLFVIVFAFVAGVLALVYLSQPQILQQDASTRGINPIAGKPTPTPATMPGVTAPPSAGKCEKWVTFPNSCADTCASAQNPKGACLDVITESCDCGASQCWNGDQCIPNPGQPTPPTDPLVTNPASKPSPTPPTDPFVTNPPPIEKPTSTPTPTKKPGPTPPLFITATPATKPSATPAPLPTVPPSVSCIARPDCLYSDPSCTIIEPAAGWCASADFDSDGDVDLSDYSVLQSRFFLQTKPGAAFDRTDLNRDRRVDGFDYAILVQQWNTNPKYIGPPNTK